MINENDFVIDSDQLSEDITKVTYQPNIENSGPISSDSIFTFDNKILIGNVDYSITTGEYDLNPEVDTSRHKEVKAHIDNINGKDTPTMNQYFCNISILKNI